jgi:hypothetical protein
MAAGVVIGASDFVIDALRDGWKPSHFVNGPLQQLRRDHS